jgi:hypothetical protein
MRRIPVEGAEGSGVDDEGESRGTGGGGKVREGVGMGGEETKVVDGREERRIGFLSGTCFGADRMLRCGRTSPSTKN